MSIVQLGEQRSFLEGCDGGCESDNGWTWEATSRGVAERRGRWGIKVDMGEKVRKRFRVQVIVMQTGNWQNWKC